MTYDSAAVTKWHLHQTSADLGVGIASDGGYVPWRARCAPGLGWPLADRRGPSIDPGHVQVLLSGQARRRIREAGQ